MGVEKGECFAFGLIVISKSAPASVELLLRMESVTSSYDLPCPSQMKSLVGSEMTRTLR